MNENLIDIRNYAAKKEKKKSSLRKMISVGSFLGPYTVSFLLFFVFPLLLGIVMAFGTFNSRSFFPEAVGTLKNFQVLFGDTAIARDFWNSVGTTVKFAICIVPLSILIPLALALLINIKPKGYKFFRAAIYVPGIFPLTATGLILMRMFDSHYGLINSVFNLSIDWFGEVTACWFMIGLLCVWCGIGGNFIIMCAALENVDKTLYEAANMDGCSKWEKFWNVTFPGIQPQLFLILFTCFTGYMNVYGQIYILGSNNPDISSMKSAVYRIQDILAGSNPRAFGYAAAMGLCLGAIIIVIAIIQMICNKEREEISMPKDLNSGNRRSKTLAFIVLTIVSLLMLLPIFWGFIGSFRESSDFFSNPDKFFPSSWDKFTLDGYKELFSKTEFVSTNANEWYPIWNWLLNSLIVALGGTLIYLVIASMAAYAFVFLEFKWAEKIFYFLIATMTIPGIVSTTPQLINMNMLGAYKSLIGLIIPSFGGVYGVFLIRQFFLGIPKDLVENARMDGASNFKVFREIILPLGKSALFVQGLFGFMGAWNDVQWAQLIIGNAPRSTWTLAYGLKVISDQCEAFESITLSLASAVISMIPIFIVYLVTQSKIIEGVANTGIKR